VARRRAAAANNNTTDYLDFEAELWAAADLLRGNLESAEYKHVVLGLIFLKYVSDAFVADRVIAGVQSVEPVRPKPQRLQVKTLFEE
jgi:type I restriction enzyme M protein